MSSSAPDTADARTLGSWPRPRFPTHPTLHSFACGPRAASPRRSPGARSRRAPACRAPSPASAPPERRPVRATDAQKGEAGVMEGVMEGVTCVLGPLTTAARRGPATGMYNICSGIYYTHVRTRDRTPTRTHTRTLDRHHPQVQEAEKAPSGHRACPPARLPGASRTLDAAAAAFSLSRFRKQSVTMVTGLCERCLFCIAHKK